MRSIQFWQAAVCACLLFTLSLAARSGDGNTETGWLDLVKGSRDTTVGAQVINIEEGDTADTQKVTLAIPKSSIANPDEIEEVVVIGQRPEKPEQPKAENITYEWVKDYDNDNYGLVIRVGKNTNWPIRLYLNSDPGFMN